MNAGTPSTTLGRCFADTSDQLHQDKAQGLAHWQVRNRSVGDVVERQEHNFGPVEVVQGR